MARFDCTIIANKKSERHRVLRERCLTNYEPSETKTKCKSDCDDFTIAERNRSKTEKGLNILPFKLHSMALCLFTNADVDIYQKYLLFRFLGGSRICANTHMCAIRDHDSIQPIVDFPFIASTEIYLFTVW